jgi:phage tail sheath protein FI
MANFVSPGVYTIEKDVSDYAPSVNPSIVGLVGFASRGPIDTPTLLTSPAQVLREFGTPDLVTGGQGIYAALEILQKTNQVYYVRAATGLAKDARFTLGLVTPPMATIDVRQLIQGDYGKNIDTNASACAWRFDIDCWNKHGTSVGPTTTCYAYRDRVYASATSDQICKSRYDITRTDWMNAIAAGLGTAVNPGTGPVCFIPSGFSVNKGTFVAREPGCTKTTAATMTIKTFVASSLSVGGLGDAADGNGKVFDYSGTAASATPFDVNDMNWSATPQTKLGGLPLLAAPNNLNGHVGLFDASCAIANEEGPGSPYSSLPNPNTGAWGKVPSGIRLSTVSDFAAGAYQVQSLYPGLGYNFSTLDLKKGGLQFRGLQLDVTHTNDNGRFVLNVYSDAGLEESYSMGMWKPERPTPTSPKPRSLYPEDVLNIGVTNAVSEYVKGNFYQYDDELNPSGTNTWIPGNAFTSWVPIVTSYRYGTTEVTSDGTASPFKCLTLEGNCGTSDLFDLSGGKNGDASDYGGNLSDSNVKAALIGQTDSEGLKALDSEATPITMAAVPGITDQSVQNELITLAQDTQNFLAVVSPPVGFRSAQQAIAWSNGGATGRTASINSSYAAVYWPWVKSFDSFTASDKWFDPATFAIGQMCYTDEVADPWFAPAGLRRGRLTKPTDVEVTLNQGDRDALYGPGNVVNPITKFMHDGIVIYGQKTTQRAPTALDRINVRRMMIYLRRLVLQAARRFVFEPNDPITWEAVRNVISPALADIQMRRGITQFAVVCDSTTNTPLRVDRNELWCKVIIKPTKTAEILVFELNLTNQSASV